MQKVEYNFQIDVPAGETLALIRQLARSGSPDAKQVARPLAKLTKLAREELTELKRQSEAIDGKMDFSRLFDSTDKLDAAVELAVKMRDSTVDAEQRLGIACLALVDSIRRARRQFLGAIKGIEKIKPK